MTEFNSRFKPGFLNPVDSLIILLSALGLYLLLSFEFQSIGVLGAGAFLGVCLLVAAIDYWLLKVEFPGRLLFKSMTLDISNAKDSKGDLSAQLVRFPKKRLLCFLCLNHAFIILMGIMAIFTFSYQEEEAFMALNAFSTVALAAFFVISVSFLIGNQKVHAAIESYLIRVEAAEDFHELFSKSYRYPNLYMEFCTFVGMFVAYSFASHASEHLVDNIGGPYVRFISMGLSLVGFCLASRVWFLSRYNSNVISAIETKIATWFLKEKDRAKLLSVGKVANLIVHDLSTPLTAVSLAAKRLKALVPQDEKSQRYTENLEGGVERSIELVRSLRAYLLDKHSETDEILYEDAHNLAVRLVRILNAQHYVAGFEFTFDEDLRDEAIPIPSGDFTHILLNIFNFVMQNHIEENADQRIIGVRRVPELETAEIDLLGLEVYTQLSNGAAQPRPKHAFAAENQSIDGVRSRSALKIGRALLERNHGRLELLANEENRVLKIWIRN